MWDIYNYFPLTQPQGFIIHWAMEGVTQTLPGAEGADVGGGNAVRAELQVSLSSYDLAQPNSTWDEPLVTGF